MTVPKKPAKISLTPIEAHNFQKSVVSGVDDLIKLVGKATPMEIVQLEKSGVKVDLI